MKLENLKPVMKGSSAERVMVRCHKCRTLTPYGRAFDQGWVAIVDAEFGTYLCKICAVQEACELDCTFRTRKQRPECAYCVGNSMER